MSRYSRMLPAFLFVFICMIAGCGYNDPSTPDPSGNVVIIPEVESDPDGVLPSWTLVGPEETVFTGQGDSVLADMVPGNYTIEWEGLKDYTPPVGSTTILLKNTELVLHGIYTFASNTIMISPDPADLDAPWSLTTPLDLTIESAGDTLLSKMKQGAYTLVWGRVPGFDTPPPETATLETLEQLLFAGHYICTTGTMEIDPNPDALDAPWTLVGADGVQITGEGDASLSKIPAGDYTLTWGAVDGYLTPEPAFVTIEAESLLTCVCDYRLDNWVTSIDGSFAHGEIITLGGYRFGTKERADAVAWDDMEAGAFSDEWSYTGDLMIGTESRHANSSYCGTLNMQGSLKESANKAYFRAGTDSANPWFAQFWFKLDENFDWGTTSYGNGDENLAGLKFFRMWSTTSESENMHINGEAYGNGLNLSIEYVNSEGEGRFRSGFKEEWTKDVWHCLQFEYLDSDQGVNNGECRMWFDGGLVLERTNLMTREDGAAYKRPQLMGFYDAWNDAGTDRDDFYIDDAYIDNSWARVELGDNVEYSLCTHREIQPLNAWMNERVEFTVNQGSFESGSTAYIFVTDRDGEVSTGYPVVIE